MEFTACPRCQEKIKVKYIDYVKMCRYTALICLFLSILVIPFIAAIGFFIASFFVGGMNRFKCLNCGQVYSKTGVPL
jgi:hypothetical protein